MAKNNLCPGCKKKPKHGKSWGYCKPCSNERRRLRRLEKEPAKIYCPRGAGSMMPREDCIPGVNDACVGCESLQKKNRRAVHALTPEEEAESKYKSQAFVAEYL